MFNLVSSALSDFISFRFFYNIFQSVDILAQDINLIQTPGILDQR
jgi:hypothetical protein